MSLEGFFAGLDSGADALQAGIINQNKMRATETANQANLINSLLTNVNNQIKTYSEKQLDFSGRSVSLYGAEADREFLKELYIQRDQLQAALVGIYPGIKFAEPPPPSDTVPKEPAPLVVGEDGDNNQPPVDTVTELDAALEQDTEGFILKTARFLMGDEWEIKRGEYGDIAAGARQPATDEQILKGIFNDNRERHKEVIRQRRAEGKPVGLGELIRKGAGAIYDYLGDFFRVIKGSTGATIEDQIKQVPSMGMLGTEKGVLDPETEALIKADELAGVFDVGERSMAYHSKNEPDAILKAMKESGQNISWWDNFSIKHLGKQSRDHLEDYFVGRELVGTEGLTPWNISPEGRLARMVDGLTAVVRRAESGGDGYNAVALSEPDPKLTTMTIGQVYRKYGETATGAFQFKHSTIYDVLKRMLGMSEKDIDKLVYNKTNQDKIFEYALKALGVNKMIADEITQEVFHERLANMFRAIGPDKDSRLGEPSDDKGNIVRGIVNYEEFK